MGRVSQPIPPVKTVLSHYAHDAAALRRQSFISTGSRGDAGHINGEASLVQRVSGR
jgi:hypothetical protein